MTSPLYDIVAIGNAIVDVICSRDDEFVAAQGLEKGLMRPIAPDRGVALHEAMGACEEVSGGSAANTLAGLTGFGVRAAFVGQVGDDRLGRLFRQDMADRGIVFDTPPLTDGTPTGRCLIIVTPDGHRTMNTAIGASEFLPQIDRQLIADSAVLFVEGYMWATEQPRVAVCEAITIARHAGRKVAFTLSAEWCIRQHRADFRALIESGQVDILFANEGELAELTGSADFDAAVDWAAAHVGLLIATRGADGAIAVEGGMRHTTPAEPIGPVVDTTGAGDLFATGVLIGLVQGRPLPTVLRMGSIAAGKIITQIGPRLATGEDLAALMAARLG
ncbi:adenosine kinase [Sphingomonas sp. YR710]|uniref:adenosine kinase n=1 Tax=Sphingomonas sp. YR710 TaxID=1882773 RepID=UPI000B8381D6|nr:adenosine kinase [Sphingomonas sp. YR710]